MRLVRQQEHEQQELEQQELEQEDPEYLTAGPAKRRLLPQGQGGAAAAAPAAALTRKALMASPTIAKAKAAEAKAARAKAAQAKAAKTKAAAQAEAMALEQAPLRRHPNARCSVRAPARSPGPRTLAVQLCNNSSKIPCARPAVFHPVRLSRRVRHILLVPQRNAELEKYVDKLRNTFSNGLMDELTRRETELTLERAAAAAEASAARNAAEEAEVVAGVKSAGRDQCGSGLAMSTVFSGPIATNDTHDPLFLTKQAEAAAAQGSMDADAAANQLVAR